MAPRRLEPRGRDANENENEKEKKEARARALVDANHLRRDDEGFRPSDLARLAGDAKLHAWLAAEEKAHDEEEADAETRGGLAEETRARARRVSYAFYPPTTFYGAASLGDVSLLSRVLREDVYELNDDIAGVGSVLHVAVARGHAALVAAALAATQRADVNRKSSGAFGLTPLHIAATLFTRRRGARASRAGSGECRGRARTSKRARDPRDPRDPRACDGLHAADGVKHSSRSKKQARREEKSEVKKARRDAHGKAAEARKVLAVRRRRRAGCGADISSAAQAGADTRAVAKVPAKFVFRRNRSRRDERKSRVEWNKPADLGRSHPRPAGGGAAAELAALELEVAEAPPALFHVSRHVCSSSEIQANGERTVRDDDGRRALTSFVRRDPTTKKNGTRPASDDGNPTRLGRAAASRRRRGA